MTKPLSVVWISDFPVEWLGDLPPALATIPKGHALSWQRVLWQELCTREDVKLQVLALRKNLAANLSFVRKRTTFHLLRARSGLRAPTLFWTDTLSIRGALRAIEPDLVHAWGTERCAELVASRLGYPYLVTMHGLLTWLAKSKVIRLNRYQRFSAWMERLSLHRARLVTVESAFGASYLRNRLPDTEIRQIEHAPDWIFHRLSRSPQTTPPKFLFAGYFCHNKGGDLLVQAFDRLMGQQSFELTIAGPIDQLFLERLKSTSSPHLWEHVCIKDNLDANGIADELAKTTMLVFPSRAENSPNAVKEAAVAGVPVVASGTGAIPDYIFPGKNGYLFANGDLSGFVSAIKAACNHPLFAKGTVDGRSLEDTRAHLSPALMARLFIDAYHASVSKYRSA